MLNFVEKIQLLISRKLNLNTSSSCFLHVAIVRKNTVIYYHKNVFVALTNRFLTKSTTMGILWKKIPIKSRKCIKLKYTIKLG